MQIWSSEIKEIEKLHESLRGQIPELEKELDQLIKTDDPNVLMLYSRRCLEVIITDLCECELKRPRKTEPLKGIIDKLNKEEKVPSHIITSMDHVNSLSTYGAHPKDFDPEQVKPVLNNLATIIKWYLKYKETERNIKAKPTEEVSQEIKSLEDDKKKIPVSNKRLIGLIAGLILLIVIIVSVLLLTNISGYGKPTEGLEKSIAVLPFENLSSDPDQAWFSDGITDVIINQLSKISDLRVLGRTSTLAYKDKEAKKSLSEIGEELGVNFLVEGTVQRQGDEMRIVVQLIRSKNENHLWSEIYDRKYQDIFAIQSEIARLIANELEAIITPEERQLIEKAPTANLTAYDFYQRGREEHIKYWIDNYNKEALERAEDFYHKALKYDPSFAQGYTGLAEVYWDKNYYSNEFFMESFLDSALILADIALSFDDQLAEAYTIRGNYYNETNKSELALQEYDKAIKFNPNYWEAYVGKGRFYLLQAEEMDQAIINLRKASMLHRGSQLPTLLNYIALSYQWVGFMEQADLYTHEAVELNGDSAKYFFFHATSERYLGNYKKGIEFFEKAYALDSGRLNILSNLAEDYAILDQKEKSLNYARKYVERLKTLGFIQVNSMHRIGYSYLLNGFTKEAEYYFGKQKKFCEESIKLERPNFSSRYVYYDLAAVYALRGDKENAIVNLQIFNQRKKMPIWVSTLIKNDPLFDNIRNEPEFREIIREIESKYQAEHERIRKWLEEQEML